MTEPGVPAFEVSHLTKTYRKASRPANDDISLTIPTGTIYGIFGPNGAGKTTLVRQMVALLKPTRGSIAFFGRDILAQPGIVASNLAFFGQHSTALRNHTMRELLMSTGVLRGIAMDACERQADVLIEQFDLEALCHRRIATLSGGEQRLASLLSCLMGDMPVLVCDEPTNELDPERRRTLWDYLIDAKRERGATIVLTTHNLTEAETVVDEAAIVAHGRVVAAGSPGQLKQLVGDAVRISLSVRAAHRTRAATTIGQIPGSGHLRDGRWEIATTYGEASTVLASAISRIGLEALDDFRVITPSFDDVYRVATRVEKQDAGFDRAS